MLTVKLRVLKSSSPIYRRVYKVQSKVCGWLAKLKGTPYWHPARMQQHQIPWVWLVSVCASKYTAPLQNIYGFTFPLGEYSNLHHQRRKNTSRLDTSWFHGRDNTCSECQTTTYELGCILVRVRTRGSWYFSKNSERIKDIHRSCTSRHKHALQQHTIKHLSFVHPLVW